MKRFAVAIADAEGELSVEILSAPTWQEAALAHSMTPWNALSEDEDEDGNTNEATIVIPDTISLARVDAGDWEHSFDIIEIPDEEVV
jgi:hypothetical protein